MNRPRYNNSNNNPRYPRKPNYNQRGDDPNDYNPQNGPGYDNRNRGYNSHPPQGGYYGGYQGGPYGGEGYGNQYGGQGYHPQQHQQQQQYHSGRGPHNRNGSGGYYGGPQRGSPYEPSGNQNYQKHDQSYPQHQQQQQQKQDNENPFLSQAKPTSPVQSVQSDVNNIASIEAETDPRPSTISGEEPTSVSAEETSSVAPETQNAPPARLDWSEVDPNAVMDVDDLERFLFGSRNTPATQETPATPATQESSKMSKDSQSQPQEMEKDEEAKKPEPTTSTPPTTSPTTPTTTTTRSSSPKPNLAPAPTPTPAPEEKAPEEPSSGSNEQILELEKNTTDVKDERSEEPVATTSKETVSSKSNVAEETSQEVPKDTTPETAEEGEKPVSYQHGGQRRSSFIKRDHGRGDGSQGKPYRQRSNSRHVGEGKRPQKYNEGSGPRDSHRTRRGGPDNRDESLMRESEDKHVPISSEHKDEISVVEGQTGGSTYRTHPGNFERRRNDDSSQRGRFDRSRGRSHSRAMEGKEDTTGRHEPRDGDDSESRPHHKRRHENRQKTMHVDEGNEVFDEIVYRNPSGDSGETEGHHGGKPHHHHGGRGRGRGGRGHSRGGRGRSNHEGKKPEGS